SSRSIRGVIWFSRWRRAFRSRRTRTSASPSSPTAPRSSGSRPRTPRARRFPASGPRPATAREARERQDSPKERVGMISDDEVRAYHRDGVIVARNVLGADVLAHLRSVVAELVAGAAAVAEHTDVYDLEPGHRPETPRVRRIKAPHKVHSAFDALVRSQPVLDILTKLIGPNLRLHGSKLNMKSAQYGSPVEWHQDWAFYPHTNDDILAIGVLLDDTDLANGPMLVTPGTHRGPVWSHHGDDGRFIGLIDPDLIRDEIARAVPCVGPAGSMS